MSNSIDGKFCSWFDSSQIFDKHGEAAIWQIIVQCFEEVRSLGILSVGGCGQMWKQAFWLDNYSENSKIGT